MFVGREEIFGPVVSMMRAPDLDAAITLANRSRYGNTACLFTQSGAAARTFRERIQAGMLGINVGVPAPMGFFPFGGWKDSIYGYFNTQGADAVAFYTRKKVITDRWFGAEPRRTDGFDRTGSSDRRRPGKQGPDGTGAVRETTLAVEELAAIVETRVNIRGSVHNLGEPVPRGFLQVATVGEPPEIPTNESGRRELAEWLASAKNPLTARVFVNRVWQWLFGVGIVRTPDNFGTTGERPSHPELLDDLAIRFIDDGWSIKRLVRRIVLSRAYRLSTADEPRVARGRPRKPPALASEPSPPRRRMPPRRDARRRRRAPARDGRPDVSRRRSRPTTVIVSNDRRRSVYLPVFRNALPEIFEVFDFADPSMVTGRRNVSTVAPQALFLMNHPFVIEQSRATARRLLADPSLDDPARLTRLYRLALGRPPSDRERTIGLAFVAAGRRDRHDAEETWAMLVQALFGSIDFRYR